MPDILITPSSGNIRFSQLTNDNSASISLSGNNLLISSLSGILALSGLNGLTNNGIPVSTSGHNHIAADITNFNSSVSGLVSGLYAPLNNPNFSGTLSVSGIPLGEIIDDEVAGLLVAGSGINLNYNDASNTLTVDTNVTTSLVAGTGISLVYNSSTDELSINSSGGSSIKLGTIMALT